VCKRRKKKESATGGRESANNKFRTATSGTERTVSYNMREREDHGLEREHNE